MARGIVLVQDSSGDTKCTACSPPQPRPCAIEAFPQQHVRPGPTGLDSRRDGRRRAEADPRTSFWEKGLLRDPARKQCETPTPLLRESSPRKSFRSGVLRAQPLGTSAGGKALTILRRELRGQRVSADAMRESQKAKLQGGEWISSRGVQNHRAMPATV